MLWTKWTEWMRYEFFVFVNTDSVSSGDCNAGRKWKMKDFSFWKEYEGTSEGSGRSEKFGFKIQTQVKLAYLNLRKMLVQLTIFQSVLPIR